LLYEEEEMENGIPNDNEQSLEVEDEYDPDLKQPAIQAVSQAEEFAEQFCSVLWTLITFFCVKQS